MVEKKVVLRKNSIYSRIFETAEEIKKIPFKFIARKKPWRAIADIPNFVAKGYLRSLSVIIVSILAIFVIQ